MTEVRPIKEVIYYRKENVTVAEQPLPSCGPSDGLLKTVYASVCGTGAAMYCRHGPGAGTESLWAASSAMRRCAA